MIWHLLHTKERAEMKLSTSKQWNKLWALSTVMSMQLIKFYNIKWLTSIFLAALIIKKSFVCFFQKLPFPPPCTTNLAEVVKASTPITENGKNTSLEILETFQQCICFRINEGLWTNPQMKRGSYTSLIRSCYWNTILW